MSEQNHAAVPDDIVRIEHVSNSYYENQLGIFGKRKKTQVLRDVSLTIHRDEFFGLVGESGCGKSTLANCILGMVPFEGTIEVAGMTYGKSNRKEFTRHVQAVFQDPLSALDPRRRIGEILREPLDIHGIGTKEEREAKVKEMLETVGLDESYASRLPRELSGGQRQRVCIGASLMLEPELVIADEAISALERGEPPLEQDHSQATKAPKLKKEDGLLDWNRPAREIHNLVRGLQPWPGAWTALDGKTLRVRATKLSDGGPEDGAEPGTLRGTEGGKRLWAKCGDRWIELLRLQPQDKREMLAKEFWCGLRTKENLKLG